MRKVADLPKPEMLPRAAELFTEMIDRSANATPQDVVRLFTVCGKMKLLDSLLFDTITNGLEFVSFDDMKKTITACNRLKYSIKNGDCVNKAFAFHQAAIVESDMRTLVSCIQYIARSPCVNAKSVYPILDGLSKKVNLMKADPELLRNRAIISADDAVKYILAIGKIQRSSTSLTLSATQKEDVKYLLTKILAYELRNVSLQSLLKLFFSLTDIGVFDDFFVRRRLVPAIGSAYRALPERSPRETFLVVTMVSQLPFSNPLTVELTQSAIQHAQTMDAHDEFFETTRKVLETLSKLAK